jgi:hypothetical protein
MTDANRDEELDELERELSQDPYIESPDEINEGEGQTCFLNQDRRCASDCTAYNVHADLAQGPDRCVILVYSAGVILDVRELVDLSRKAAGVAKRQADDEARVALVSTPIPNPFGGNQ